MDRLKIFAAAAGAGLLLAASLPPWGWWPLAFAGVAAFDLLIADRSRGTRFRRGMVAGLGLYIPSLAWMTDMTVPGYAIAAVAYAALLGGAACLVPARAPARWLALPGAVAVTELLRWSWPFGGVPLSNMAIGQVSGPLAPVLRIGGAFLLVQVTVIGGLVLAAALRRNWTATGVAAGTVALLLILAGVAPSGRDVDDVDVALVQGGGRQGTRARTTDAGEVFERHRDASQEIEGQVDLVLWPEDVVDVEGPVGETRHGRELSALARDLEAPLVAGVVEGVDSETFANASVVYDARGEQVDRYDKVHRVPFGEYVPLRSLIEPFGGEDLTERDAVPGEDLATVTTGAGRLAVAISWEVFFGDRVREGVGEGADIVVNPTNGSSFTGTLVQTQQIASSRMRAIETGRWVLQVAPTGFSAIIDESGTVHQRTGVSEQAVLQGTVTTREGSTVYTRLGLLPGWIVAIGSLVAGSVLAIRRRRAGDPAAGGEPSDDGGDADGPGAGAAPDAPAAGGPAEGDAVAAPAPATDST